MSTTSTKSMRKLPPACFTMLNGQAVWINRGNPEPSAHSMSLHQINWQNHNAGVTAQQVQAMICGVTFGWDHPSADPDAHCAEPMPLHYMEVAVPLTVTIPVEAYSTEDAIEQALAVLTLPEGYTIDGRPLITRKH